MQTNAHNLRKFLWEKLDIYPLTYISIQKVRHQFIKLKQFVLSIYLNKTYTVFLSFLKRERERTVNVPWTYRERFPLFVPKRYCVTTRTFLDVLDRSTSLTVQRPWPFTVPDRSWPFLSVCDRFRPFYERFRSFVTFKTVLIITTYI